MKPTTKRIIIGLVIFGVISLEAHVLTANIRSNLVSASVTWQFASYIIGPTLFGASLYYARAIKDKSDLFYFILRYFIPIIALVNAVLCTLNIFFKLI